MIEPYYGSYGTSFFLDALTKKLRMNQEADVQARAHLAYRNSSQGEDGP